MLLADNTVGWFAMIYQTHPLKTGESFAVSGFYPDRFEIAELTISVRPAMKEIEYAGKVFPFFVCDVTTLNEVHYVFASGQLMKVEKTGQNLIIQLTEYEGPQE